MKFKRQVLLTAIVGGCVVGCGGGALTGPGLDAGSGGSAGAGGRAGNAGAGGTAGRAGDGGSAGTAGGGGAGVDAGSCLGKPADGTETPTTHRSTATACTSPTTRGPAIPAGGTPACVTNADCAGDAGSLFTTCLQGHCSFDKCLTDADCGANAACVCATDYYGGNTLYHANACVTAQCHVDADCGPGGYCSASQGYCGSFLGFYCHSPADTCVDPTKDCVGCGNACVYSPTVGAFTCGMNICAG